MTMEGETMTRFVATDKGWVNLNQVAAIYLENRTLRPSGIAVQRHVCYGKNDNCLGELNVHISDITSDYIPNTTPSTTLLYVWRCDNGSLEYARYAIVAWRVNEGEVVPVVLDSVVNSSIQEPRDDECFCVEERHDADTLKYRFLGGGFNAAVSVSDVLETFNRHLIWNAEQQARLAKTSAAAAG
jgi:hypothetical protein